MLTRISAPAAATDPQPISGDAVRMCVLNDVSGLRTDRFGDRPVIARRMAAGVMEGMARVVRDPAIRRDTNIAMSAPVRAMPGNGMVPARVDKPSGLEGRWGYCEEARTVPGGGAHRGPVKTGRPRTAGAR